MAKATTNGDEERIKAIISEWRAHGRPTCARCGRTFNTLTGTPLAQLHRRDAWLDYARALVARVSLRKSAGCQP